MSEYTEEKFNVTFSEHIGSGGELHNELGGRTSEDCHPISAITNLTGTLQALGTDITELETETIDRFKVNGVSLGNLDTYDSVVDARFTPLETGLADITEVINDTADYIQESSELDEGTWTDFDGWYGHIYKNGMFDLCKQFSFSTNITTQSTPTYYSPELEIELPSILQANEKPLVDWFDIKVNKVDNVWAGSMRYVAGAEGETAKLNYYLYTFVSHANYPVNISVNIKGRYVAPVE